jgi:hypothetical protein
MIRKYAISIDKRGMRILLISPRERVECEEFWELAEEIGLTDLHTRDRAFFHRFFTRDDEETGKK